jgi:hypothetical protein
MNPTARRFLTVCVALLAALANGRARAAGPDEGDGKDRVRPNPVADSAAVGSFLPFTHPAALDTQTAYASGTAGFDSARNTGMYEAAAEVRLWGPLSIRGGAVYARSNQRLRPSFGARVQALRESRNGLDGSLGVFYRPEGLTEAEGELEAVLSAGVHLGATYLVGNLVYGQDPEGRERDGEVRVAALRPVASRLLLGVDGQMRFDLGSSKPGKVEPALDAFFGPAATVLLGPVALLFHAGGSAFRLDGATTSFGAFVLGGVGTAF